MADNPAPPRRLSTATLALGAAAVLAIAAVGIAAFRSNDPVAAPAEATGNAQAAPSLAESIAALQEQLRRDPDNHEAWFMLGLALRDDLRLQEAEQAFRRAMELAPQNAEYTAYAAEMVLLAATRANRPPPPEAERLFRRALELEPGNAQARFYLATLKDQAGDHRGAVDDMIALLRDAPAGEAWPQQVRESVLAIARLHDIDVEGRLPPPQPAPAGATAAIPGPSREQMEAARGIPPSQQDAMVRGMVERLAARLRQNPRDADGWIRLMRSRMVLNDPAAAREALNSGLAAFEGDAATQTRLRQAAQQLGVPNG
jgi:cytochrome c-type biogenesis protein CcmH